MGKKKNRVKNGAVQAARQKADKIGAAGLEVWDDELRRAIRLQQLHEDGEEDEECGRSIRSDAATHPDSDDTIAAFTAVDCDFSVDGVKEADAKGGVASIGGAATSASTSRRKRTTWRDLEVWWDGECAPFTKILHDLMYDMSRGSSESIVTAYEILSMEDQTTFDMVKGEMIGAAKIHGCTPLPINDRSLPHNEILQTFSAMFQALLSVSACSTFERANTMKSLLKRAPVHPDVYDTKSPWFFDLIQKWSLRQSSYLPSGKFQDLGVGRWASYDMSHLSMSNPNLIREPPKLNTEIVTIPPVEMSVEDEHDRTPSPIAGSANPRTSPEYVRVNVSLYSPDGLTTIVSLKTTTKMGKLKEKHSRRLGRPIRALVYRYKGKNLKDNDTVRELGMKENDVIHVLDAVQRRH